MRGFKVTDTPGYDTHGLPIEVVIEKQLGIKNKQQIEEYGMNRFIEECRKYALEKRIEMDVAFKRLGCVFWAWDRPYITLHTSYLEGVWWTLKKAWENGLLYKFYKPQNCCPRCATALAKHEFDYMTVSDTSIFVKFKEVGNNDTWFVIWTTTPWTLVANEAIMANPMMDYVKVEVTLLDDHKENWILAHAAATNLIMGEMGLKFKIVERMKGEDLAGRRYIHPLAEEVPYQAELEKQCDKVHTIILSKEYVSEGEGVGLVHTAPGHGPEDFEVGVSYGIPVFNPVDARGIYTPEAGVFTGKFVFDMNEEIVQLLEKKGTLLRQAKVEHEYAHCWRCKSKLVYRATEQWFFKTTALKDQMLKENAEILWIPKHAGDTTFQAWLENIQDWCISRQRFWGIPLPIWLCNNPKCDAQVVAGSRKELMQYTSDVPEDIHRPWIDKVEWSCQMCGKGTMRRIPDILDVWLDSGSVMWSGQEDIDGKADFDHWIPADFIIEGKDQIRGWFNSLLCSAMVSSKRRNYNACFMTGWVTRTRPANEKGKGDLHAKTDKAAAGNEEGKKKREKLSKSAGDAITPELLIDGTHAEQLKNPKWSSVNGIETFRFYSIGGAKPGLDLNFDWKEYANTYRVINTIWNTYVFANSKMMLVEFNPATKYNVNDLGSPEKWILSRLNSVIEQVTNFMEVYEITSVPEVLQNFILNDVSRWYIPAIRNLITESSQETLRNTIFAVLWEVLWKTLLLLAPVNPMLTEEIYLHMFQGHLPEAEQFPSIHLHNWPKATKSRIIPQLEAEVSAVREIAEAVRTIRADNKLKLKWPSKALYVVLGEKWKEMSIVDALKIQANVRDVKAVDKLPSGVNLVTKEIPNATITLDIALTSGIMASRITSDLTRGIQFTRKLNNYNAGEEVELIISTKSTWLQKVTKKLEKKLCAKVTAKTLTVQETAPANAKDYSHAVMYFCPKKACRAMIKSKQAEQAKKTGNAVKCFYCGKEFTPDRLKTIEFYFKRV
jgi:isoleucyl-tRNA synthetase